jgi:hypothetical protein
MENPGMRTLTTFLRQVERNAPVNFSGLCAERRKGYGMVNRYISYCLSNGLIRVVVERRTRGRYPSRTYELSLRGATLLSLLGEKEAEAPHPPHALP